MRTYLLPLCERDGMSGREKLVGGIADTSAVVADQDSYIHLQDVKCWRWREVGLVGRHLAAAEYYFPPIISCRIGHFQRLLRNIRNIQRYLI